MIAQATAIERAGMKMIGFMVDWVRSHRIVVYETIIVSNKREILALVLISLGGIFSC
jgi:hypothetical protein